MPTSEPCVEVHDVHKSFKRGSEVLDVLNGLNLNVEQGEFVALMGPSGSGTTTLLNLIAGLDQKVSLQAGEREVLDSFFSSIICFLSCPHSVMSNCLFCCCL